jgi:hypothetical protein
MRLFISGTGVLNLMGNMLTGTFLLHVCHTSLLLAN